jgi:alkanesulfonate monooxygenase SsuD/methylene tetrahydromethanopterin reductase-like flavin-dependent oxidoreductase (luciferase family)
MPTFSRPYFGVELSAAGTHPAGWTETSADPQALFTGEHYVSLARLAESGRFDFLTIDDSFAPPEGIRARLDALLIAARIGPATDHIGLLPTVTTTHTEPFHVSKSLATLDYVSSGRAGWNVEVSTTAAEAAHFGRKAVEPAERLWAEAGDAIDVVRRLWDSWEDGAEIREAATGRFIDREKLHYVDFAGEFFSVRGPSITPRPPQGQPLVSVRVDEPSALPVAAQWADIVRSSARHLAEAVDIRHQVRAEISAAGRDPDQVAFLVDVSTTVAETGAETLRAKLDQRHGFSPAGLSFVGTGEGLADLLEEWLEVADGFTLSPTVLPQGLDELIPALTVRGLLPATYQPGSLRDRFGLPRPASRYAA